MAISLSQEQLQSVKSALAERESSNNYQAVNQFGYLGKYQFGAAALEDTGYLKPGSYKKYGQSALKFDENWTGKNGASNSSAFLDSKTAQENAMDGLLQRNYNTGLRLGALKSTSTPDDVGGFLSAAHLGGAGSATKYFKYGEGFADGNGTQISEYDQIGRSAIFGKPNNPVKTQQAALSGQAIPGDNGRFSNATTAPVAPTDTIGGDDLAFNQGAISNKDVGENVTIKKTESGAINIVKEADGTVIAEEFLQPIETKENPFKKFATMTYSVSLYVLPREKYNKIVELGQKDVTGLPLIIQSGGINNATDSSFGAYRAEHFPRDYYIDDIELQGLVSGTSTQSVHNQFSMSFTITEPNGLTLLDNLKKQVAATYKASGETPVDDREIPYASQLYLMVIRSYGYDIDGNIVDGTEAVDGTLKKRDGTSDENAFSEKFIPFMFRGITFSIDNSMVTYKCEAVCPQSHFGTAMTHTAVPEAFTLQGNTVEDILSATDNGAESLMQYLNAFQDRLVKEQKKLVANEYIIEFEQNSGIHDKTVTRLGEVNKRLSGNANKTTTANQRKTKEAGGMKKEERQHTIPQGTSIIKIIEEVVRNSAFVTDQQNIAVDKNNLPIPKAKETATEKHFKWFKVRTQVKQLEFDKKQRDYAYQIKFIVSQYDVGDIKSPVFPGAIYRGVHKRYPYWFTGENTEVLSLTADYNYLYFQVMTGSFPGNSKLPMTNTNEVERAYYQPKSTESGIMGDAKSAEIAASAASVLYSPADQATVDIEIIGDPDWIAQSEIFYSGDVSLKEVGYKPYMPDGSVNFDASSVYFSVEYNTPEDYGVDGLIEIGKNDPYKQDGEANNMMKLTYRANMVTTYLRGGSFKQRLQGTLMMYRDPAETLKKEDNKQKKKVDGTAYTAEGEWGGVKGDPHNSNRNFATKAPANLNEVAKINLDKLKHKTAKPVDILETFKGGITPATSHNDDATDDGHNLKSTTILIERDASFYNPNKSSRKR